MEVATVLRPCELGVPLSQLRAELLFKVFSHCDAENERSRGVCSRSREIAGAHAVHSLVNDITCLLICDRLVKLPS
jgi:hypothetical protein